jgi:trans-aconitate 2-methyltransferase
MPPWDPSQYMKFGNERTQPSIDLVGRIPLAAPRRIVDLGCGPGNSTEIAARRWPEAAITGVDNSADMLAAAAKAHPDWRWEQADIGSWSPAEPYDLVFSNAALQWVGDHPRVFPALLRQVAEGGALAVQMPRNYESPSHALMRRVAEEGAWRERLRGVRDLLAVRGPDFYYDLLAPAARRVEIWETEYGHVMESPRAILEWVRGTGLRPFLEPLDAAERQDFEARYLAALEEAYPRRADGKVLFPFRRLFIVALR